MGLLCQHLRSALPPGVIKHIWSTYKGGDTSVRAAAPCTGSKDCREACGRLGGGGGTGNRGGLVVASTSRYYPLWQVCTSKVTNRDLRLICRLVLLPQKKGTHRSPYSCHSAHKIAVVGILETLLLWGTSTIGLSYAPSLAFILCVPLILLFMSKHRCSSVSLNNVDFCRHTQPVYVSGNGRDDHNPICAASLSEMNGYISTPDSIWIMANGFQQCMGFFHKNKNTVPR